MCLSAFWVFFINIFILNKFGICRDKKKNHQNIKKQKYF